MKNQQPFLDAIHADPDDDAVRLIFADWLDENGQEARAELIRVQCALARFKEWHAVKEVEHGGRWWQEEWAEGKAPTLSARLLALAADEDLWRSFHLYPLNGEAVVGSLILVPRSSVAWCWQQRTKGRLWRVRRGFVDALTCAGVDWLRHGHRFLHQQPLLREVVLTTLPEVTEGDESFHGLRRALQEVGAPLPVGRQDWFDVDPIRLANGLLAAVWPGITFHLPGVGKPPE